MTHKINKAVEKAAKLLKIDGVVGVAQGEKDNAPCVVVFTAAPSETLKNKIPETVDGFPVVLFDSGPISAQ